MERDKGYPGLGDQKFKIILNPEDWRRGDVLTMDKNKNTLLKVTKVYRYTWWRRLLVWFGYPRVKMFTGIRVKTIDNGK